MAVGNVCRLMLIALASLAVVWTW